MSKQSFLLACAAVAVCVGGARAQAGNMTVYKTHSALINNASTPTAAPNVITQSGYTAAGDGGWAEYDWNATSTFTPDGCTVIQPNGQSAGTPGRYLLRGNHINALVCGADRTETKDSEPAFQLAASSPLAECVYIPEGNYLVKSGTTFAAQQACVFGAGRERTTIWAYSTSFNLSALGVFILPNNAGGSGADMRDIGFDFNQPQTGVRANIVAFPPAIYAQGHGRATLSNVRVSDANVCLDARGNDGGWFVDNFECGALTAGMYWDGALDAVHWNDFHFWNFGSQLGNGNPLQNVFFDGNTICFQNGNVEDLFAKGDKLFPCLSG